MSEEIKDRKSEQIRVDDVIEEIDKKVEEIYSKASHLKDSVVDLRKDFWDDVTINLDDADEAVETHASIRQQAELLSERERSHRQLAEQLKVLKNLKESPYFGRIDFHENCEVKEDQIYIGMASLMDRNDEDFLIYDWRAPISSLYYDYTLGKAQYETMNGRISGDVNLKRQFIIEDGVIEGMFDTGVTIGDHLLQQALGNNASSIMKSIVATIQQEQNKIIRNEKSKYLVVQGVAGSGKTSAALQRVAYLMYRYREVLHENNIVLFSPNRLFNSYVSHVLPELGEANMKQTTFLEYLGKQINHEFVIESPFEQMEYILSGEKDESYEIRMKSVALKSSLEFKHTLDDFISSLRKEGILFSDIIFREKTLISKEEITDYFYEIDQKVALSNAMNLVSTWLLKKINNYQEQEKYKDWVMEEVELLDDEEYLEAEQYVQEQEDVDDFYNSGDEEEYLRDKVAEKHFAPLKTAIKAFDFVQVFEMYQQLFTAWRPSKEPKDWKEICKQSAHDLSQLRLTWEDATPYLYVKGRLIGDDADRSVRHLFIDEAQDYTAFQLAYIKHVFPHTRMTFLGDINQVIYAYTKEGNPLQSEFEDSHERIELTKSYRSTKQIVEFTKHFTPGGDTIQPFERVGAKPQLIEVNDRMNLSDQIIENINDLKEHGHEMIAIICKTFTQCDVIYEQLKDHISVHKLHENSSTFEKGVLILPIYLAKGIEFDAVIIPDASKENYYTELDRSLFYTACTRAMHELVMLTEGEHSDFISEAPEETYEINK